MTAHTDGTSPTPSEERKVPRRARRGVAKPHNAQPEESLTPEKKQSAPAPEKKPEQKAVAQPQVVEESRKAQEPGPLVPSVVTPLPSTSPAPEAPAAAEPATAEATIAEPGFKSSRRARMAKERNQPEKTPKGSTEKPATADQARASVAADAGSSVPSSPSVDSEKTQGKEGGEDHRSRLNKAWEDQGGDSRPRATAFKGIRAGKNASKDQGREIKRPAQKTPAQEKPRDTRPDDTANLAMVTPLTFDKTEDGGRGAMRAPATASIPLTRTQTHQPAQEGTKGSSAKDSEVQGSQVRGSELKNAGTQGAKTQTSGVQTPGARQEDLAASVSETKSLVSAKGSQRTAQQVAEEKLAAQKAAGKSDTGESSPAEAKASVGENSGVPKVSGSQVSASRGATSQGARSAVRPVGNPGAESPVKAAVPTEAGPASASAATKDAQQEGKQTGSVKKETADHSSEAPASEPVPARSSNGLDPLDPNPGFFNRGNRLVAEIILAAGGVAALVAGVVMIINK